ncbi:MAG: hypothetical protein STHCBS139747_001074 [Sporothrix thermara]
MSNPSRVYLFPKDWHISPKKTPDVGSVITTVKAPWAVLIGPERFRSSISRKTYPKGTYDIPRESTTFSAFLITQPGAKSNNVYQYSETSLRLVHSGYSVDSWEPTRQDLAVIASDPAVLEFLSYLDSSGPKYVYVVTAVRIVSNLRVDIDGSTNDNKTSETVPNQYKFGFRVIRLLLKVKDGKAAVRERDEYTNGALYDDRVAVLENEDPEEYDIETTDGSWLEDVQGTTAEIDDDQFE